MGILPCGKSVRHRGCVCLFSLVLILSSFAYAQPYVETPRQNVGISPQINGYWEYLPFDYAANPTKKYPLLVFIHGWGEIGTGNLPSMALLLIHGVPRVIEWNIFPQSVSFNGQSYSFIVLSPQYLNLGVSVADLDAFLNYAFTNYRVDRNRVYLTGFSNGASLCYLYAGHNSTYAQKVTGIVPLSPCIGGQFGQAQVMAVNNVAVWGIHGSQDVNGPCHVSFTPSWINIINTANNTPPTPPAVYSLIPTPPGADTHDIFWGTFEQGFSAPPVNMNMYRWMIQYARNTTLPLTLKKFSAVYNQKNTIVDWITTNESNTKEFLIERAGRDLKFRTVASVPAIGNSNNEKDYKWVDNLPLNGINYYRLQLINLDNTREYFEIRKVIVGQNSRVNLVSSNPVGTSIKLIIELERQQRVKISIADMQGRILYDKAVLHAQGRNEIVFNPGYLPSGSYILRVNGESFTESKKITRH